MLIRFSFRRAFSRWAGHLDLTVEEVSSRFLWEHDAYLAFERGEVTVEGYVEHLAGACGLALDLDVFLAGWNRIFTGVDATTYALYRQLSDRDVELVGLTNTNPAHVPVWRRTFAEELSLFDEVYASSEIGARKPEPTAFRHVLEDRRLELDRVVFVDDTPYCVEGARDLGIESYLFTDAEGARWDLRRAGFPV